MLTNQLYKRPSHSAPEGMTVIDISDDDDLRFIQRVLESYATQAYKDTARDLIVAIRTRLRKERP